MLVHAKEMRYSTKSPDRMYPYTVGVDVGLGEDSIEQVIHNMVTDWPERHSQLEKGECLENQSSQSECYTERKD